MPAITAMQQIPATIARERQGLERLTFGSAV
jgi:hypothetical protein